MKNLIKVWRFEDAPKKYRKLSTSGGDEDWVVLLPKELYQSDCFWVGWLGHIDTCHEPDLFEQKDGSAVYIGSH